MRFSFFLDRIDMILQDICVFLYLKFPEEILNEQSATPKRESLAWRGIRATTGRW